MPAVSACPSSAVAAAPPSAGHLPKQVIEQRQDEPVESLAFTPDGRRLVTASAARVVSVWDVRDRALLRTLRVPGILPPISVEWSAIGHDLVIGQQQSVLVDPASETVVGPFFDKYGGPDGSKIRRVPGHPGRSWIGLTGVSLALFDDARKPAVELKWPAGGTQGSGFLKELSVSTDGRVAAAAMASKGVFAWNLDDPAAEGRSVPIDGDAVGVAVAPRGDRAYVAVRLKSGASRVDVVSLSAGKVESALAFVPEAAGGGDWITSIALSADGAVVAAGSLHRVTAWEAATGARRWVVDADRVVVRSRHDLQSMVGAVAFSPVEPLLAAANARGDVYFLDSRTGRLVAELGIEARRPHALLFADDGRSLLAVSATHASKWSIDGGRLEGAHLAPGAATGARLPKGDFLVGRAPLSFQIPLPTDPPPACEQGTVPIFIAPWSDPDALAALPGFVSRGLRLVSGATPAAAPTNRARFPPGPICVPNALGLSDLNVPAQRALVRFLDNDLGVVGLADKRTVMLKSSKGFLFAPGLSSDGQHATASNLQSVVVWDTATGDVRMEVPLPAFSAGVATAFSPDGSRLAVASGSTVLVRALPSGKQLWVGAVTQPLFAVTFAGDGRDVFVGSLAGSIALIHEGQVAWALDGSAGGGAGLLAVSPDGQLLASMHQDGAVRVWDTTKKTLRATLVDFDDDEWAITTPGGAFTGTDEVARRIGWVFDAPMEHFGFEQFAAHFRDDAVVRKRLATGEGDVADEVHRPPSVSLVGEPSRVGGKTRVRVHASSPTRVDAVLAFREGRALGTQSVCSADGEATFDLPELGGENRFTFSAVDDRGLVSRPLAVDVTGQSDARPKLWLVGVGVSKYPRLSEQEQLHVAHVDAASIIAAFSDQAGPGRIFASVDKTPLLEDQATVKGIRDALSKLAAMGQDDLAVVFFAGHGIKLSDSSDMRFLTSNAAATPESVAVDGIGWSEIADKLGEARGRVLLLLDACHSGHMSQELIVPNGALAATLSSQGRAGALVFAAAKGRQESFEDREHGFFTRAILDTFADPTADRDRDGHLSVDELIDSVTVRVDVRTHGRQTPWVARREVFGDFQIATPLKGAN